MDSTSETGEQMQRLLQAVPGFPPSQCLLSSQWDKDTAVIFVHGIDGSAVGSWTDFPGLISASDDRWWGKQDVYFYGYRWTGNLADMTIRLSQFVAAVFPVPDVSALFTAKTLALSSKYLSHTLSDLSNAVRDSKFCPPKQYKDLVLVGHSQGSVLVRRLIIDEALRLTGSGFNLRHSDQCPHGFELLMSHVRLFAPVSVGIGRESFRGFFSNLLISSPVLPNHINPAIFQARVDENINTDTQLLLDLQENSERFATRFDWSSSLKAHVAYGTDEDVGYIPPYGSDVKVERQEGKTHESVCKPSREYRFPLTFVQDATSFRKRAGA